MSYFFLVIGLGMGGMALNMTYKRITFLLRTRKTYGRVVGWEERPGFVAGHRVLSVTYYFPEVAFEASDGVERRVTSPAGWESTARQSIGDRVGVRYDPRNPDDARVDAIVHLWSPPAAFLLIAGAALFAFIHARH